MILRLGLAAALTMAWSCSGDKEGASEPVSATPQADVPAKIPDAPGGGDSGEAAPNTAGTGAAAVAAAPEKTKPSEGGVEQSVPASNMPAMTVKPGKLHVRQGPGTANPIVRTLAKGEKVTPVGCEKKWCKLGEGEFVSQKYLQKAP